VSSDLGISATSKVTLREVLSGKGVGLIPVVQFRVSVPRQRQGCAKATGLERKKESKERRRGVTKRKSHLNRVFGKTNALEEK
jgi:hypothetical protein